MHGVSAEGWIQKEILHYRENYDSDHWWCADPEGFINLLERVIPYHDGEIAVQMLCNTLDKQVEECLHCLAAHHRAQVMIHNLGHQCWFCKSPDTLSIYESVPYTFGI